MAALISGFRVSSRRLSSLYMHNTKTLNRLSSCRYLSAGSGYDAEYKWSIEDPEGFWMEKSTALSWDTPPSVACQIDETFQWKRRWFPDGAFNISYNCLDRHVASGRGDQPAIDYHCPLLSKRQTISYSELTDQVSRLAHFLQNECNVRPGDSVLIYMPMIPQVAVAMLACARIAAVHTVVFGGFAAKQLAVRIDDVKPQAVIAATHGLDGHKVINYKRLLEDAYNVTQHKVKNTIVYRRDLSKQKGLAVDPRDHTVTAMLMRKTDYDFDDCICISPRADAVMVPGCHPLYALHTSGTTGVPKGVIRDHAGYATVLNYSMKSIYNLDPGQVMFTASDVGWVVGHSYIIYGPLLHGCTSVLFDGKPIGAPDAGAYWKVIEQSKVNVMFTAPTALRAVRGEDPEGTHVAKHDLSSLQALFVAGERADPATVHWATRTLNKPVLDHYWQTETGWPVCANSVGLEGFQKVKDGSVFKPVPGYNLCVLGRDAETPEQRAIDEELGEEELGHLVARLPLPPGTLQTLTQGDQKCHESYFARFPGYYDTSDAGVLDADGYVHIMARTDDIINIAGHRLSTGELEQAITSHPSVVEAAVVGVPDAIKGELAHGVVVASKSFDGDVEKLKKELVAVVRLSVGPVAAFQQVHLVTKLPKTRSGKTLRNLLRSLLSGREAVVPPTIEDEDVVSSLKRELEM